ncbi:MAG: choice-of-anchor V domain-containing protein [Bacteroidia bacterium]
MRKRIFTGFTIIVIALFYVSESRTSPTGAPSGHTNAPGESVCANSSCHTSNPLNSGGGSVSISIEDMDGPVTSYTAGEDYTITISLKAATSQTTELVGGFQLVALDNDGTSRGSFTLSPDMKTTNSLIGGNLRTYATHTMPESFFPGTGHEWALGWTAPASPAGALTFYAAANSGNGDGTSFGDFIYANSFVLDGLVSIRDNENTYGMEVFPTVTRDVFHVKFKLTHQALLAIELVDLQGRQIREFDRSFFASGSHFRSFNANGLESGIYFLRVASETENAVQKIFIR